MGFFCPERQTTADFLTSVTSPAERIVASGFETKVPRTPDEFAEAWKKSDARAKLLSDIYAYEEQYELGGEQVALFEKSRREQQAKYT